MSEEFLGPDPRLCLKYAELPIGATTVGFDPNMTKTGTWRFIRPLVKTELCPCNEACPAGVDIRGFISLMQQCQFEQATELYLYENPFPAVCGRVCFHPCETACNRGAYDEAVSINGLEDFIGGIAFQPPFVVSDNGRSIAVIGSGPAGLAGAYFLRRLGYAVQVYERAPKPGGIMRYGIPEYRLPKKVLDRQIQRLVAMGIGIQTDRNLGENLSFEQLNTGEAIFVATGAQIPATLNVPGIEVDGVYLGLDFLKKVATGELKEFKKKVAVMGGGNTAIDAARTVRRLGGKPTIYYRRDKEDMPAAPSEILDCEEEGIEVHCLVTPVRVLSAKGKTVGMEFLRNKPGEVDESGRRRYVPIEGTNFRVDTDAVILAVGETTELSPYSDILKTDGKLIVTNEFGQTTERKIFAGGDIIQYQRTIVDAIGSGKRAAIGIDCYLNGMSEKETLNLLKAISTGGRGLSFKKYLEKDFTLPGTDVRTIHFEDLNPAYFHHERRSERRKLPIATRTGNFEEVRRSFTVKAAQRESERCFTCGMCNTCGNCFIFCPDGSIQLEQGKPRIEVNYEYCKGCGICANECPIGVIHMTNED